MSRVFVPRHSSRIERPVNQENSCCGFRAAEKSSRVPTWGRTGYLGLWLVWSIMTLGLGGCASVCSDGGWVDQAMQRHVSRLHDRVWAKRAFHLRYGHCKRVHADHFEDGFIAGYCDVCKGGNGQSPTLPPEKYWGFQYRTREGAEMQNAWFAGFEAGTGSARTDGGDSWRGVRFSQELQEAIREERRRNDVYRGIEREYIVDVQPVEAGSGYYQNLEGTHPGVTEGPIPMLTQPGMNTPATLPGAAPLLPVTQPAGYGNGPPIPSPMVPTNLPGRR